jgi:hypothetical protein
MTYESRRKSDSKTIAGVSYEIRRMSLGRRIELSKRIHELSRKIEFLNAGESAKEQIEALWLRQEIDRVFLLCGVATVEGLEIDGKPATIERLIEEGPEELTQELLAAVRAEAALSESERKN